MQLLHSSLGLGRSAAPATRSSRSRKIASVSATARPSPLSGGARKPQRAAEDRDVTASAVASRAPESSAPANGKAAVPSVPSTRCGDPPVPVAAPKSELTAEEIGKLDGVRVIDRACLGLLWRGQRTRRDDPEMCARLLRTPTPKH